ncbi:LANO_0H03642g1_1 [Lachancea nothofagi CBS 11611]|uniref:LANO_0H03642g1_1 n=1 Tax=Lachancea nothofagi CBS 11611 TaxID=1266666 RepID=A0A1G4KLI6_9SACH|nr:LANO_0H03642g1_1 [Lachancea nothofagi CBS 11611]
MFPTPLVRFVRAVPVLNVKRSFQTAFLARNKDTNSSLFGSITQGIEEQPDDPQRISNRLTAASSVSEKEATDPKKTVTVANDKLLQSFIHKSQSSASATDLLLSPLKKRIYEENCRSNGGFYKKDSIVTLTEANGQKLKYKLNLSREEIEALEPSIYVKSYRLKSSMKKATQFLRLLGGADVTTALSQCHFSDKKVARDVAEVLTRGVQDAEKLGIEADNMYIAQIWTGSDGYWQKRIDIKARGRNGVITHPYVHVRCILKTKDVTKRRIAYEQQLKQERRKPWVQLNDQPVRGAMGGVYKW